MKSSHKHKGLIFFIVNAFIFLSFIASFAGTTTYQYDDVNRAIRVERGTPGGLPKTLTLRRYSPTESSKGSLANPWRVGDMTVIEATLNNMDPNTDVFNYYQAKTGVTVSPATGTLPSLAPGGVCTGNVCKLEGTWAQQDLCEFGGGKYEQYDKLELASDTTVSSTITWYSECPSYLIQGNVMSGGSPLSGVTMTLSGAAGGTTTPDSKGKYTFRGLANGAYTVTPSKTGYVFTPTSRNVTISGANVTHQDFTGTAAGTTYSISGAVKTSTGTAIAGVTMTLSGTSSRTTTTDSNGNYTFTGLANGAYTVTPGKTGYTFTPVNRNITINGANVTGQDFTGSQSG